MKDAIERLRYLAAFGVLSDSEIADITAVTAELERVTRIVNAIQELYDRYEIEPGWTDLPSRIAFATGKLLGENAMLKDGQKE